MKKRSAPYIILAVLFCLFNVFAFAIPSEKTSTFWVAYGFTIAMFCIELAVLFVAFPKDNTAKKQFLSWPLVCVGSVYFIIQTIVFLPFKLCPSIQPWIALTVLSLVFGIALICIIATKAGSNLIKDYDEAGKR